MVTEGIDAIFNWFSLLFNSIVSHWALGSLLLVSILGLIVELVIQVRNK